MDRDAKPVGVFVSSTFADMTAERDHLVEVVFPELRYRLGRLGLELRDVDLRWGVLDRGDAGEDFNPWRYCKKTLYAVEPLFVGMLGSRYGSVPGLADLDDDDQQAGFVDLSITEMEIRHALRLGRRCFFYLRAPQANPQDPRYIDPLPQARLDLPGAERISKLLIDGVAVARCVVAACQQSTHSALGTS